MYNAKYGYSLMKELCLNTGIIDLIFNIDTNILYDQL